MDEAEYQKLIPELALWNDGNVIDIDTWLSGVGSYELALAYHRLFWPEFLVHDNCVFLRRGFNLGSYDGFLRHSDGDKPSVEQVMNHIHLADLFVCVEVEPTREILIVLGEKLREVWEVKLAHDFPDRVFEVVCNSFEKDEMADCQIKFFQPDISKENS